MAMFSKKFLQKGSSLLIPLGMTAPFINGQVLKTLPASIPATAALMVSKGMGLPGDEIKGHTMYQDQSESLHGSEVLDVFWGDELVLRLSEARETVVEEEGIEDSGERQVDDEAIGGDSGCLLVGRFRLVEAGLDHPPSNQALHKSEAPDQVESLGVLGSDPAERVEQNEWECVHGSECGA